MPEQLLKEAVDRFLADLTPVFKELFIRARQPGGAARPEVIQEAYRIARGVIMSDSNQTDEQLGACIATFGPLIGGKLSTATPGYMRLSLRPEDGEAISKPSRLFRILCDRDKLDGTENAPTYARLAADVARAMAAADANPSQKELDAVINFRRLMDQEIATRAKKPLTPPAKASYLEAEVTEAPTPTSPVIPIPDLMAKFGKLVGLEAVKKQIERFANLIAIRKLRAARGMPNPDISPHLMFTGNPGTGKTTVATLMAELYRSLGVVPQGKIVVADRSNLVSGYVGQTAQRVRDLFKEAEGGVLLIDEAYALAQGGENDFGREAIDALVKLMEDNRGHTAVILAGYPEEMEGLLNTNPGLRSRVGNIIHFPDYSTDDLMQIFDGMCAESQYVPSQQARLAFEEHLASISRGRGFGNGRVVRNLFEQVAGQQATRLVDGGQPEALSTDEIVAVMPVDVPNAEGLRLD